MRAAVEGPDVPTGQEFRAHLAHGLAHLAYGLFCLAMVALLLAVPVGVGWLAWRWLGG